MVLRKWADWIDTEHGISDLAEVALPPIQHTVDTDALEALFTDSFGSDLRCSFTWNGYPITIHADGKIEVDISNDMRGGQGD